MMIPKASKVWRRNVYQCAPPLKATETINQKLTPLYVQYEAIQAQEKMVNSANHTEIYIPVGPMGVPLVGTFKPGQEGKE